jgi:hypothetical protein
MKRLDKPVHCLSDRMARFMAQGKFDGNLMLTGSHPNCVCRTQAGGCPDSCSLFRELTSSLRPSAKGTNVGNRDQVIIALTSCQ